MRIFFIILNSILIVIGVSFALLNAEIVHIDLYVKQINMPLSLVLTITFSAGLITSFLLFFMRYWRLKRELYRINEQLQLSKTEVKNLRGIPLKK